MNSEAREIMIRRGERGSSYVIALLALFVLTILGLALVVLTQNEVQIGANERTINRVFYAAEAGGALTVAKTLTAKDYSETTATLFETHPLGAANVNLATVAKTTLMIPTAISYCGWCPTDNDGTQFYKVTHMLNVTTDAVTWTGGGAPPAGAPSLGEKTIGMVIEVQPWKTPDTISIPNALSSDLTKVVF